MTSDTPPTNPRLAQALRRLSQLVDWERADRRADMGRTLEPVRDLAERLGNPQRAFRVVHVTGTKGKSTTTSFIAAGLARAGWRTGTYQSPHVERITERVRIAGAEVDEEALARALERALAAREAAEGDAPARRCTYFDVLTIAGFEALRAGACDWAVVECGLGGRLDSTNIVRGEVCVITNVDLEHTEVLGATRAKIAAEKVGILDPGALLVTAVPRASEAGEVIAAHAAELAVEVRWITADGALEERNAHLAGAVLEALGERGARARSGLTPLTGSLLGAAERSAARLPGRLEVFHRRVGERTVAVGMDGAHVAASIIPALSELRERAGIPAGRPAAALVLALRRDKDVSAILKTLPGEADTVLCTSLADAPFLDAHELATRAREEGLRAEVVAEPEMALERALELAAAGCGFAVVLGSLYLCGRLRPSLTKQAQ